MFTMAGLKRSGWETRVIFTYSAKELLENMGIKSKEAVGTVITYSLQELLHDIRFHSNCHGYSEENTSTCIGEFFKGTRDVDIFVTFNSRVEDKLGRWGVITMVSERRRK